MALRIVKLLKPKPAEVPRRTNAQALAEWRAMPPANAKAKPCPTCGGIYINTCTADEAKVCANAVQSIARRIA